LGDIDLHNETLKVLGKRNKERYIPLISSVIDSLNLYIIERNTLTSIKDKEYLFLTKKGVKIYETLVYRIINDYFSKVSSKVKRSPHILRHSFATHLLNQGANLNAVKELLGHSSLAATQIYTHNSISELKKVYSSTHPRSKK
jgi:integrase/recombinase XerC